MNRVSPEKNRLNRHRLRPAHDLPGQMTMEGIHWSAGKGVVGLEEELKNFRRGIPAVSEQRDHAGDESVEPAAFIEEQLGDVTDVVHANRQDLAVAEQIHHFRHHHAHALGGVWDGDDGLSRRNATNGLFQNNGLCSGL